MIADQHGLEMTAASADAVRHYDAAIGAYLGFERETGSHLKAALAADPDLVMGHCVRGYFMKLFALPVLEARAVDSLGGARRAAEARGAGERELTHIEALGAWCAGDLVEAANLLEAILLDHPRDALALRLAHHLHFYMGDAARMRDSAARALYAWDESVPGYGFVLGLHAFGLEEAGDYGAAEAAARRAIEINPSDIWAVHALAHVMEMQGRLREGIACIRDLEDAWDGCNNFRTHIWWHRALWHWELGEEDEALGLYDARVRAEETEDPLDMSNAASLLWRLEDGGMDVGGRWDELAGKAEGLADGHVLAFFDAHYMMALAAGGRDEAAARMLDSTRQAARRKGVTEASVLKEVGLPLAAALLAYRAGEWGRAVDLLLPVRYQLWRLGGSHAQRDVFALTLIRAALKAGRFEIARALLAERTALKPRSPRAWASYAEALAALDGGAASAAAREQAEALLAG